MTERSEGESARTTTLSPGTRVDILPARLRHGVVMANHKTGVLVMLDNGGPRYYDESWLAVSLATETKENA